MEKLSPIANGTRVYIKDIGSEYDGRDGWVREFWQGTPDNSDPSLDEYGVEILGYDDYRYFPASELELVK